MSKIELPKRYRAKDKDSDRYFEGYYFEYPETIYCFVIILFTLGCLITFYALDHGWDKEWIDKEDRENGNNR
jgi:c-di-GMP-related signal transduction protein